MSVEAAQDREHRADEISRGVAAAVGRATRCTATSLSVSLANSTPSASSSARRMAKFSMIPLWTTANLPAASRCGWALRSVGLPWVAHRVWPTPVPPTSAAGSVSASASSRFASRPARLRTVIPPWPSSNCDSRRVVTAVFHPAQRVDHDVAGRAIPDVADDSTHGYTRVVQRRSAAARELPSSGGQHQEARRRPVQARPAPGSTR